LVGGSRTFSDAALYQAKDAGCNRTVFSEAATAPLSG
jgi:hypothetical protein